MAKLPNVHPGEVLREDYLVPLGMTPDELAKGLGMPLAVVTGILDGACPVTPSTALRLSRFFGASAQFWLNLQAAFDLEEERERLAQELEAIRPWETGASLVGSADP